VGDETALSRLREALRRFAMATFRVYRTAGGQRARIDREFEPEGREAQEIMAVTSRCRWPERPASMGGAVL